MVEHNGYDLQSLLLAIPTREQIHELAADIRAAPYNKLGYSKGPRTFFTVGAGVVRIRKMDQAKADETRRAREGRDIRARMALEKAGDISLNIPMAFVETEQEIRDRLGMPDPELAGATGVKRGRITAWTAASKNRMQLVLAMLDYSPLFDDGRIPAMVTLTMPGRLWEECVPTPQALRDKVALFKQRYVRAWGVSPVGVWKLEFQQRGAPHLHILMTPPAGISRDGLKLGFKAWLGKAWASVVAVPDGVERQKHENVGTGIDYPTGQRYNDPKRIAQYFSKHGAYKSKDYQNEIPEIWLDALDAGAAGARFWGYWGLEKAIVEIELRERPPVTCEFDGLLDRTSIIGDAWEAEEQASWSTDKTVLRAWARDQRGAPVSDVVTVERHLRRLARSIASNRDRMLTIGKKRYRPVKQMENVRGQLVTEMRTRIKTLGFDPDTGAMRTKRVIGYYQGGGGFLVVNDGRVTGDDVRRLLGGARRSCQVDFGLVS